VLPAKSAATLAAPSRSISMRTFSGASEKKDQGSGGARLRHGREDSFPSGAKARHPAVGPSPWCRASSWQAGRRPRRVQEPEGVPVHRSFSANEKRNGKHGE
jgi:hypothetical protein